MATTADKQMVDAEKYAMVFAQPLHWAMCKTESAGAEAVSRAT